MLAYVCFALSAVSELASVQNPRTPWACVLWRECLALLTRCGHRVQLSDPVRVPRLPRVHQQVHRPRVGAHRRRILGGSAQRALLQFSCSWLILLVSRNSWSQELRAAARELDWRFRHQPRRLDCHGSLARHEPSPNKCVP